jgi:hypothetical protein
MSRYIYISKEYYGSKGVHDIWRAISFKPIYLSYMSTQNTISIKHCIIFGGLDFQNLIVTNQILRLSSAALFNTCDGVSNHRIKIRINKESGKLKSRTSVTLSIDV